jgi:hypothetical protein
MEKAGLTLRLRWLWFSQTDASRAWQGLVLRLDDHGLGDGCMAKFWEDRWLGGRSISEIELHLYAYIPKCRHHDQMACLATAGHATYMA